MHLCMAVSLKNYIQLLKIFIWLKHNLLQAYTFGPYTNHQEPLLDIISLSVSLSRHAVISTVQLVIVEWTWDKGGEVKETDERKKE